MCLRVISKTVQIEVRVIIPNECAIQVSLKNNKYIIKKFTVGRGC